MLTALILATMTQFPVIGEQQVVSYELQTTTYQQYSLVPVVRSVPTVTYPLSEVTAYPLPMTYFMRADPLYLGGRAIIRERGPGFRSRIRIRY